MSTSSTFLPSLASTRLRSTNLWSAEELRRLKELASGGMPLHLIAGILRRSASSIRNKATMHGISLQASQRQAPASRSA